MDKPKLPSRFKDRSIPAVAKSLGMPPHELRRAAHRGEVATFQWGGLPRISVAEEQRIRALAEDNAT